VPADFAGNLNGDRTKAEHHGTMTMVRTMLRHRHKAVWRVSRGNERQ
jgi:hypothetical protein